MTVYFSFSHRQPSVYHCWLPWLCYRVFFFFFFFFVVEKWKNDFSLLISLFPSFLPSLMPKHSNPEWFISLNTRNLISKNVKKCTNTRNFFKIFFLEDVQLFSRRKTKNKYSFVSFPVANVAVDKWHLSRYPFRQYIVLRYQIMVSVEIVYATKKIYCLCVSDALIRSLDQFYKEPLNCHIISHFPLPFCFVFTNANVKISYRKRVDFNTVFKATRQQ